jgi:glycine C-acetyltransferase
MTTDRRATWHARLDDALADAGRSGLRKRERVITSAQGPEVRCDDGIVRLNLCANNYLGLSGSEELRQVAADAIGRFGYGLSSVRFICGTQSVHRDLERALARFVRTEDAILYGSAFDANGGLFETLFDRDDVIVSDELNHASIIDGTRLARAQVLRYRHDDMADLERQLQQSAGARCTVIATDGVFSMDGTFAQLDRICDLADRYGALVMVDDSHATGFVGAHGRGTHEHFGVMDRVDIITGTLGKALGGAMGGFTAARAAVVETLRQRSRPYLFSNSLAPVIAATTLHVLQRLESAGDVRERLLANARRMRAGLAGLGYTIPDGTHPIIPVMIFDDRMAQALAARLYDLRVLVTGFVHPVVPRGKARVRVQVSSAHTAPQLDAALQAFDRAGQAVGVLARPGA